MAIRAYSELDVWREAMSLAESCYRVTAGITSDERFGLVAQMRRSAVSIPSNIAEGHNRRQPRALRHYLSIALGSKAEFETQNELARRLNLLSQADAKVLADQASKVGQLLSGFRRSVRIPKADRE
jgi:four helix bundle protein